MLERGRQVLDLPLAASWLRETMAPLVLVTSFTPEPLCVPQRRLRTHCTPYCCCCCPAVHRGQAGA